MKNAALNLDQLEGTMLHDPHNSHLFTSPNFFGITTMKLGKMFKNKSDQFINITTWLGL